MIIFSQTIYYTMQIITIFIVIGFRSFNAGSINGQMAASMNVPMSSASLQFHIAPREFSNRKRPSFNGLISIDFAILFFKSFNGQQVCPVYSHTGTIAVFPSVVHFETKDVDVSRVVRHFRMCAACHYVRNVRCRILFQRPHRFRTDMRVMVPTPTIEFFIFFRCVAGPEQFPLD